MFGKERTNKMKTIEMQDASPDAREHAMENEQPARGRTSPVEHQEVSRRSLLKGASALAGLTVLRVAGPEHAFAGHLGEDHGSDNAPHPDQSLGEPGEDVIPWLDQPAENPFPDNLKNLLKWEDLDTWRTPTEDFFSFNHFGQPNGLNEAMWRVNIGGLVAHPQSVTLADLKARRRREVDFTLECSGNHGTGLDFLIGAVGNARWAGARLAHCWRRPVFWTRATKWCSGGLIAAR